MRPLPTRPLAFALLSLLALPLAARAQSLTEERGFDRKGNDYTSFRARGLRDCKDACYRDRRCVAYTFDTRNEVCYLKDRINSKKLDSAMITGYREEGPQGPGGPGGGHGGDWDDRSDLTEERGFDRKGNDYTSFRARGLWDCKSACAKDRRCVAYTFDTLPHIGVQDGLHYAMGYCGSGVSLATYFGMRVGQQVLGKAEGKSPLDNVAFQTRPLYTGNPWFLAPSIAYYRWRDKRVTA